MRKLIILILFTFKIGTISAQEDFSLKVSQKQYTNLVQQFKYKDEVTFSVPNLDVSEVKAKLGVYAKNSGKSIYTISQVYLVPLIYASETRNSDLLAAYDEFFSENQINNILSSSSYNALDKIIFLYFNSEYIRMRNFTLQKSSNIYIRNDKVSEVIKNYIIDYWNNGNGKVWSSESLNYIGKKNRVGAIINHLVPKGPNSKSYYSAITDAELFTMGVGSSLAAHELYKSGKVSNDLLNIVYNNMVVLKTLVKFQGINNAWLLQPGVWADHADYKYAGKSNLNSSSSKTSKANIAWDASHFSRMPGFLNTLGSLFSPTSENGLYISKLQDGLASQFYNNVVLKKDNSRRTYGFTNYMNGDGIYRFNYKSKKDGYNSSSNITHVFWGWWKLLNNDRINSMYGDISKNYNAYLSQDSLLRSNKDVYFEIINLK